MKNIFSYVNKNIITIFLWNKEENEKMVFNDSFFKRSKYENKKENRAVRKIFNPDFQKILL